ncbi:MAG: metallophosphoesterase [Pseudomonadales bacterium]
MNNAPLRLIQITDCHLPPVAEAHVRGYNVDQRLRDVVTQAEGGFDHLLLTGDLTDPACESSYTRLLDASAHLATYCHWIPGNHDDRELMAQLKPDQVAIVDAGNWAIVLLDSTFEADGKGSGSLNEETLQQLSQLQQLAAEHILIVMHHPAFNTDSAWQDAIKLGNSASFWQALTHCDKVRGVVCGHLHQAQDQMVGSVRVLATPAVAPQFKVAQSTFTLEDNPELMGPAYRTFELYPSGRFDTQLHRIPGCSAG